MATEKPRFTITLDDETFERVAQFQADGEFSTRSKAIQNLIERGLESVGSAVSTPRVRRALTASSEAQKIAAAFDAADQRDKSIVRTTLAPYISGRATGTG